MASDEPVLHKCSVCGWGKRESECVTSIWISPARRSKVIYTCHDCWQLSGQPDWMKRHQVPGLSGCCRVSCHAIGDGTFGCDKCGQRSGQLWKEDTPDRRYHHPLVKCDPAPADGSHDTYAPLLIECAKTAEERQQEYAGPRENFERIRLICKHAFGLEISREGIANVMAAVKLSRNLHKKKKDNYVDLINYVAIAEMLREEPRKTPYHLQVRDAVNPFEENRNPAPSRDEGLPSHG